MIFPHLETHPNFTLKRRRSKKCGRISYFMKKTSLEGTKKEEKMKEASVCFLVSALMGTTQSCHF